MVNTGLVSDKFEAEPSSHRGLESVIRSAQYDGLQVNLILKTSMSILNVMQASTGSQCNFG